MRIFLIPVCLLALLLSGCASTETVKEAKGQGVSHVYEYSYDTVYDAVLAAAKNKELDIEDSDKNAGRILLSHGTTWMSWGEKIAVFVKMVTDKKTEVEVVSEPVMSPLNFPPDWENILHQEINLQLGVDK